jgi:hypothetical protein
LVDSFECVKMHGPTNPKFKKELIIKTGLEDAVAYLTLKTPN